MAMVSGDETFASQSRDFLGKRFPAVAVKRAISRYCAEFFSLAEVRKRYAEGVRRAFKSSKSWKLKQLTGNIELKIQFTSSSRCDLASIIPHVERVDGYSIRYRDDDYERIFRMLNTAVMVAQTEYLLNKK